MPVRGTVGLSGHKNSLSAFLLRMPGILAPVGMFAAGDVFSGN